MSYYDLKAYCDNAGVVFLASGWNDESLAFLNELGMAAFKMASADLGSKRLIEQVMSYGKPIVISTGISSIEDIQRAYDTIKPRLDEMVILQCTSTYPCPYEDTHLRVIPTLAELFGVDPAVSNDQRNISASPL